MSQCRFNFGWKSIPALAVLMLLCGCQSKPAYLTPSTGVPEGSIAQLSHHQRQAKRYPPGTAPILMSVFYNQQGKPMFCQVERSSGERTVDERAIQYVLRERHFAKGKANTVLITVDPKHLPKKLPPLPRSANNSPKPTPKSKTQ